MKKELAFLISLLAVFGLVSAISIEDIPPPASPGLGSDDIDDTDNDPDGYDPNPYNYSSDVPSDNLADHNDPDPKDQSLKSIDEKINAIAQANKKNTASISEMEKKLDSIEEKLDRYLEETPSPMNGTHILLIAIIIIMGIIIAWLILKNKNKEPKVDHLKNYISTNLQKGYHPNQLKQALFRQGYKKEEIEAVFNTNS